MGVCWKSSKRDWTNSWKKRCCKDCYIQRQPFWFGKSLMHELLVSRRMLWKNCHTCHLPSHPHSQPSITGHCHGWDTGQVQPVIWHGIVTLTFSGLCSTVLYLYMLDLYLLAFGGQPHLPAWIFLKTKMTGISIEGKTSLFLCWKKHQDLLRYSSVPSETVFPLKLLTYFVSYTISYKFTIL